MENQGMMGPLSKEPGAQHSELVNAMSEKKHNDKTDAGWIAGRIETLLSHYFQPDNPVEVFESAMDDWISVLEKYPEEIIEHACRFWVRNFQSKRPTPAAISSICQTHRDNQNRRKSSSVPARGERSHLTFDEMESLQRCLEIDRKWLSTKRDRFDEVVFVYPELARHAVQFMRYWGEPLPPDIPQELIDGL